MDGLGEFENYGNKGNMNPVSIDFLLQGSIAVWIKQINLVRLWLSPGKNYGKKREAKDFRC